MEETVFVQRQQQQKQQQQQQQQQTYQKNTQQTNITPQTKLNVKTTPQDTTDRSTSVVTPTKFFDQKQRPWQSTVKAKTVVPVIQKQFLEGKTYNT